MKKKILALVLAVALLLTATMAFAAEVTGEHGTESTSNTFTIAKDITLFNTTAGTGIYEPNVTYTFAITAGAPGTATITDDPAVDTYDNTTTSSVTVQVKPGTGGVTLTGTDGVTKGVGAGDINVVFGGQTHNDAAAYGHTTLGEGATVPSDTAAKATRNFTVTIDPTADAFKKTVDGLETYVPGVYRYHIADTTADATLAAAGIKRNSSTLTDLTLDVYLRWSDENRTALQVYGYVLFRDLVENQSLTYGTTGVTTAKVTGFDIPSNMEGSDHTAITSTADEYHTFNTTISKTVSGALADKNNAFPFEIALTGIADSEFYYTRDGSTDSRDIAKANGLQIMTSGAATISSNLKDSESITLWGLPYNTTVAVTETNNTPDFYTPSATYKAGTAAAADITSELTVTNSFQPRGTAATPAYKDSKATAKTLNDALTEDVIAFTNNLAEISPTGIVLRVAPYALMLAAGIILLLISRKRKNQAEEA